MTSCSSVPVTTLPRGRPRSRQSQDAGRDGRQSCSRGPFPIQSESEDSIEEDATVVLETDLMALTVEDNETGNFCPIYFATCSMCNMC